MGLFDFRVYIALICFLAAGIPSTFAQEDNRENCAQNIEKASQLITPSLADGSWEVGECGAAYHRNSNLECPMTLIGQYVLDGLYAYPAMLSPKIDYGYDVSCNYKIPAGGAITIYATKYPSVINDDQTFGDVVGHIKNRFPGATPLDHVAVMSAEGKDGASPVPAPLAQVLEFENEANQTVHSGAWMRTIDGWTLKIRATYLIENDLDPTMYQMMLGMIWLQMAQSISVD